MSPFYSIFITICIMISTSESKCKETTCFCEDYGPVLYHCPKGKKTEVEIKIESNLEMHMSCIKRTPMDEILPKNMFSPPKLTVENCLISNATILLLNMTNVNYLFLEDSVLQEDSSFYSSEAQFPKLTHLVISNTEINKFPKYINVPSLIHLEIVDMNIQLVWKLLNELHHIEILKLKKNKLTSIEDQMFYHVSNLKELQLDHNSIETLSDGVFKQLKKLKTLNLANNNIKYLSREVLKPLVKLKQIELDFNKRITLDDYIFSNFSDLTSVHLRSCDLTSLPENIFSGAENITEIYLQSNNISYISKGLFKGLKNLKYIDLSGNKMKSIDGIFEDLKNLQHLELSYNEIKKVEVNDFRTLINLRNLILNHNRIRSIEERAFETNVFLERIDLSHNEYYYEVLPGKIYVNSPFTKCPNLKNLDLSSNFMKDIPEDIPVVLRNLKYLNLEGNQIEMLDLENVRIWTEDFDNIKINLRNNNISHFARSELMDPDYILEENRSERGEIQLLISQNPLICDCHAQNLRNFLQEEPGVIHDIEELRCSSPQNLKNLKFVNVPESHLVCDLFEDDKAVCTNSEECSCLWRPFDGALIVNCSYGNLTEAPVLTISGDMNIKKLEVHLEGNLLTELSHVEGYENVTGLFLSRNELLNLFWIPENIEVFDVSHNHLTSMTHTVLEILNIKTVKNVSLGNNPWICDCEHYYMKEFIAGNIKKIDAENITCQNSGLMLHSIAKKDVCFENNTFLMVPICLFVLSLLAFLILSVFYYKYEQEIKVWLYARNLCLGLLEEDDLDKHKKFDIFVSYSQKDGMFVENHLVPLLEDDPYHYKLCLHYRDWVPGSFISENIANSVANSKRTLIVLTPNFLKSVWGKMEFRVAHAEAMKEKRNRVILLIKEDLDTEILDEELKSYIATNTYIKWGDPWFWKKLRYALPRVEQEKFEKIQINI